jgi:tripartite-type tricarboxylate transporter receptor subunit TctC
MTRSPLPIAFAAALLLASCLVSAAQAPKEEDDPWPQRRVTLIVPFAAGSPEDVFGRLLSHYLYGALRQPFEVENRPGSGGVTGVNAVATAQANGYTLLVGSIATHGIGPSLYSTPYDAVRDFEPIGLIVRQPSLLVVHPSLPSSLPELIAHAKANRLSYGSAGVGTPIHLAAELFRQTTGATMTHVPFRHSGEMLDALAAGQIQLAFESIPRTLPYVKEGKVRVIAVTSAERSRTVPDIPAMAQTLPGFEFSEWVGLFAPKGTPKPIVGRLSSEINALLNWSEVQQRFLALGLQGSPMTSEAFAAFAEAERRKWRAVIDAAGIKVD